ncbi:MAG TPA: gamma-glutamylcyclotransferase family protein [Bacteroidales bacterium]|nr:gamma-glutamylcyclotransferase family protein [Bacteroidales bacterium]
MIIYKVFIYGKSLKPNVQLGLFGESIIELFKARLTGWVLIEDKEKPYILPSEGKTVEGIIVSLTPEQLKKADLWKEVPGLYRRERVTIRGADGNFYNVWTYTRHKPAQT